MNFDEMLKPQQAAAATARDRARPGVGGLPQVSLLPREIRDAVKSKVARRAMGGAVLLAVLVSAAGVAAASLAQSTAQTRLDAETNRTQTLALQIAEFADVQRLQQDLALGEAAVRVGSSTQIDWQKQIRDIERDMPFGYTVTKVTADGATPVADYPQGTSPLELPRAATVQMTVLAPSIDRLPYWLRKLRSVPAYADATPTVSTEGQLGGFTVSIVVHLSERALVAAEENGADR